MSRVGSRNTFFYYTGPVHKVRGINQTREISGGADLKNIQQRLQLVYPNRHHLEIANQDERYSIRLEVVFV